MCFILITDDDDADGTVIVEVVEKLLSLSDISGDCSSTEPDTTTGAAVGDGEEDDDDDENIAVNNAAPSSTEDHREIPSNAVTAEDSEGSVC